MTDNLTILTGNCLDHLRSIPDESVQTCVTSPPYWGLRDYGSDGQIGLEDTPEAYVEKLVWVCREVRRVLRRDGTLWLNLGDCHVSQPHQRGLDDLAGTKQASNPASRSAPSRSLCGLPAKNLVGIPWRVAFALQRDGWILRSDIIWNKPNPMPESVTDRPTRAHEYIFLLSKSARYYYDTTAIREPASPALLQQIANGYNGHATKDFEANGVQNASDTKSRIIQSHRNRIDKQRGHSRKHAGFNARWDKLSVDEQRMCGSNKRSVWTVAPANFKESHFATFPPDLIKPCILAGCPVGGVVLDPFAGSGTSGQVALELGRRAILIELNPDYVALIRQRCNVTPGLPLA